MQPPLVVLNRRDCRSLAETHHCQYRRYCPSRDVNILQCWVALISIVVTFCSRIGDGNTHHVERIKYIAKWRFPLQKVLQQQIRLLHYSRRLVFDNFVVCILCHLYRYLRVYVTQTRATNLVSTCCSNRVSATARIFTLVSPVLKTCTRWLGKQTHAHPLLFEPWSQLLGIVATTSEFASTFCLIQALVILVFWWSWYTTYVSGVSCIVQHQVVTKTVVDITSH